MTNRIFLTLTLLLIAFSLLVTNTVFSAEKKPDPDPQYELDHQKIPAASKTEEVLKTLSVKSALDYIELGAQAWTKNNSCISCHTNGTYLFIRPALSKILGNPSGEMRQFYLSQLEELKKLPAEKVRKNTYPAQVIYLAAGLAEWDKHLNKNITKETEDALEFMFAIQKNQETWFSSTCWPPFESSAYQLATMAAMAAGDAPGWIDQTKNSQLLEQYEGLKKYLVETKPPHQYGEMLLLWASTRIPDLTSDQQKEDIIKMIREKQHADGGWAMRDFAKPEEWGGGNRAAKLKKEPEYENPPSDGHQTGLAVIVLRDAGIPADDPQIQKAIHWLKNNQRASGRWWTRSLNNDGSHYITYSATCYALLALAKCDALPALEK